MRRFTKAIDVCDLAYVMFEILYRCVSLFHHPLHIPVWVLLHTYFTCLITLYMQIPQGEKTKPDYVNLDFMLWPEKILKQLWQQDQDLCEFIARCTVPDANLRLTVTSILKVCLDVCVVYVSAWDRECEFVCARVQVNVCACACICTHLHVVSVFCVCFVCLH